MRLLVIRHAIAQSREEFEGDDDSLRPLTPEGRRRMKRGARSLAGIVPDVDVLGSSPLLRARQTAEIVAGVYDEMEISTVDALVPDGDHEAFISWLHRQRDAELVAVVGHEPHLGTLVTWLLTGLAEPRVPLGKGGACLLDFSATPRAGGATLVWSLTPELLQRL